MISFLNCVSFFLFAAANSVAGFIPVANPAVTSHVILQMGYVPDGMTPEQYRKLRSKEQKEQKNKKFGAYGPQSFKSRSLQSFQQDLEQGKSGHLLPVMFAKQQVQSGKIKPEDVPYMQRGGNWDNSDIKTAKKKEWNEKDKKYSEQYQPAKFDWTGKGNVRGPQQQQRVAASSRKQEEKPKQKFLGLF